MTTGIPFPHPVFFVISVILLTGGVLTRPARRVGRHRAAGGLAAVPIGVAAVALVFLGEETRARGLDNITGLDNYVLN